MITSVASQCCSIHPTRFQRRQFGWSLFLLWWWETHPQNLALSHPLAASSRTLFVICQNFAVAFVTAPPHGQTHFLLFSSLSCFLPFHFVFLNQQRQEDLSRERLVPESQREMTNEKYATFVIHLGAMYEKIFLIKMEREKYSIKL